jgi:hypothetical protein
LGIPEKDNGALDTTLDAGLDHDDKALDQDHDDLDAEAA